MLLLTLFTLISCGGGSDKSNNSSGPTSVPQSEAEPSTPRILYSAIVLEENCGFWTDCDFMIRTDFNQRPVVLAANFVDNNFSHEENGQCEFEVTLTEEEALRLEALTDKLRFCRVKNNPTADGGFDGLFATDAAGENFMVYKFHNGGQEEEGDINYLCSGRSAFYNYVNSLIVPKTPAECPAGYKRLFR